MGLPEPYGSPPGRPGKYLFYVTREGDDGTQMMTSRAFAARYAAKKWLDALIGDDTFEWRDDALPWVEKGCTIITSTGIVISTRGWPERMLACVEHELTLPEMAFSLEDGDLREIRLFRYGPEMPRTLEDDGHVREKRERRSSAPRADAPAGYVHVSDVALSMGIDSKQARVALRKLFPDGKPAHGWWFDPATLDELKARIRAVLK